jgi:hypothetical protein
MALSLLFVRLEIPAPIFETTMGVLFIAAAVGFPFAVAERRRSYEKYWPQDDILIKTPSWFKQLWIASFIVVGYFFFSDGFRSGYFIAVIWLALETAFLAPFLFMDKIARE